jgi:hypothetical protein
MVNSPNFHVRLGNVARVEVRFVRIEVNRKEIRQVKKKKRDLRLRNIHGLSNNEPLPTSLGDNPVLQPEDLNTDGRYAQTVGTLRHICLFIFACLASEVFVASQESIHPAQMCGYTTAISTMTTTALQ